jgi:hypothetical protein
MAAFLLLFALQRSRSTFLTIERQRAEARSLAEREGVALAAVLALRDLVGPGVPVAAWHRAVATFATEFHAACPGNAEALSLAEVQQAELAGVRALTQSDVALRRWQLLRERFAARR